MDIIEIDEMWHYTKKQRKLWVWIAVSRARRRILAVEVGARGQKPLKRLWAQGSGTKTTDSWKAYHKIIPRDLLIQTKKFTQTVESVNSQLRHYIASFRRKTFCYSKSPEMVELALYIFWQFQIS